jgi:phasin family protein
MSNNDPNKPAGKRGPRNRKAEPKSRKSVPQPSSTPNHKPDLQQNAKQLIDAAIAKADIPPMDAVAPADTVSIDAVAPELETVSIDAAAPELETASIAAVAPLQTLSVNEVAPVDAISIDAVAPANIVSIDAAVPAKTVSIDAVALAVTFSIGAVAPVDTVSVGFRTIANAYGDYARKSCEETVSFVERLKDVRSLEEAMEIQAAFATQAYETFVAESRRICEIYRELARQSFRPMASLMTRAAQAAR